MFVLPCPLAALDRRHLQRNLLPSFNRKTKKMANAAGKTWWEKPETLTNKNENLREPLCE